MIQNSIVKYICIKPTTVNNIQTVGKVYDITIDEYFVKYFIGDDGKSYLLSDNDSDFMEISMWREIQLGKVLN